MGVLPGIGSVLPEIPLALTLVGIGWSNTSTFAYHANAAIGDLAILLDHAYQGAPAAVTPSGFTQVGTGYSSDHVGTRFVASAAKLTTLTPPTGMTGTARSKAAIIIRPTRSITGLTLPTWDVDVSGFANPSSSTSGGGGVAGQLVVVGYTGSNFSTADTVQTQTPSHIYTEGYDPGADVRMRIGVSVYNVTGISHTVDIADLNDSNVTAAGYVVVT